MSKTIKITTNVNNLGEVLDLLKLTEEYKNETTLTIEVDIEDVKENYNFLAKTDKIISWDFVTDDIKNENLQNHSNIAENTDIVNNTEKDEKEESKEIKDEDLVPLLPPVENCQNQGCSNSNNEIDKLIREIRAFNLRDYSDIIMLFYSIWIIKREENNFDVFNSDFLANKVRPVYFSSRRAELRPYDTTEMSFIVSGAYFGLTLNDSSVVLDIIKKINYYWNDFEYDSFDRLMNKLYNNNYYDGR